MTAAGSDSSPEAAPERIIVVPFTVPRHGEVEVATIAESALLQMKEGEYALVFRHGRLQGAMWATLAFEPVVTSAKPAVLLADAALSPPAELLMSAEPA